MGPMLFPPRKECAVQSGLNVSDSKMPFAETGRTRGACGDAVWSGDGVGAEQNSGLEGKLKDSTGGGPFLPTDGMGSRVLSPSSQPIPTAPELTATWFWFYSSE